MKQIRLFFMLLSFLLTQTQLSFAQFTQNGSTITYTMDRVGIGTPTPAVSLDIFKHDSAPQLRLGDRSGSFEFWGGGNFHIRDKDRIDRLFIAGNTGNIGLGTTSPTQKLHVQGSIYADGGWLRVAGRGGLFFQSYGGGFYMKDTVWIRTYNNKSFYHSSGVMRTDGTFQVGRQGNRFIVKTNGFAGVGTPNPGSKLEVYGNDSPQLRLRDDKGFFQLWGGANFHIRDHNNRDHLIIQGSTGNMSVGTAVSTPYKLFVNGLAAKPGSSFWSVYSDKRLKKNIKNFDDGLEILQQIRPVWFSYKDKTGLSGDEPYVGVIAQEVQRAAPYMVKSVEMEEEAGKKSSYLSYDANALLYILVNSVKEQQAELDEKDRRMEELTDEVAELKALVVKMMEGKNNANHKAINDNGQMKIQSGKITDALLKQNHPNPFAETTAIPYNIPENVREATLTIMAANGRPLKNIRIEDRGMGETLLQAHALSPGTYFYTLILDGEVLETKRMIITGKN